MQKFATFDAGFKLNISSLIPLLFFIVDGEIFTLKPFLVIEILFKFTALAHQPKTLHRS